MHKASRDARRPRAGEYSRDRQARFGRAAGRGAGRQLLALLLCGWQPQAALAQPMPVEVKATQHWVLYARLQGNEPFVVAETAGAHSRLWWFDAQGRSIAIDRRQRAAPPESPGPPIGRPGLMILLPAAASTDVARAGVPPPISPEN